MMISRHSGEQNAVGVAGKGFIYRHLLSHNISQVENNRWSQNLQLQFISSL